LLFKENLELSYDISVISSFALYWVYLLPISYILYWSVDFPSGKFSAWLEEWVSGGTGKPPKLEPVVEGGYDSASPGTEGMEMREFGGSGETLAATTATSTATNPHRRKKKRHDPAIDVYSDQTAANGYVPMDGGGGYLMPTGGVYQMDEAEGTPSSGTATSFPATPNQPPDLLQANYYGQPGYDQIYAPTPGSAYNPGASMASMSGQIIYAPASSLPAGTIWNPTTGQYQAYYTAPGYASVVSPQGYATTNGVSPHYAAPIGNTNGVSPQGYSTGYSTRGY